MTVEILLAFFLWAIFLTGIVSLWFTLFNPSIPFFEYINQENFYTQLSNNREVASSFTNSFIGRGVKLFTSSNGLLASITDWQNGFGQKTCRGLYADRLRNVQSGEAESLELDGMNVASAMVVRGRYMYLATNSGSTTDPDLYIISLADQRNLSVISKIDTGPGLTSLAVAGYTLFTANTSINSQAQAVDIGDPIHPLLKWSFKVPGSQGTSTALGKAVVSNGNQVFLGTAKNASSELFSLDAETGQLLAEREMGTGVNGLFLNHSLLYVTSPIDPELLVFDTSAALQLVTHYDAPGGSGNGKSVEIVNDDIYLGRTLGGNELMHLSVEDQYESSASMTIVKKSDAKIGATVDAMIASENSLFVLTGHSQKELQVWKNVEGSDQLFLGQTIDLPARAVGIGCDGQYVYVALGTHIPILIFEPEL